jgi:hypothetical protein
MVCDKAGFYPCWLTDLTPALYAIRVREYEHEEGTFDDVIGRFAYSFERPQNSVDFEGEYV